MKKEIKTVKSAGFCIGVKMAVDKTLDLLKKKDHALYTYGTLIHNPQVVELLKEKGVIVVSKNNIPKKGTIVIKAHGITPETENLLKESGLEIVNSTCPFVVKVQKIIAK